jgi:protein-tyrosine phosphatase
MPEQMIDLHCHILPNLDDGPETMEETLVMCGMAFQDGIRTVVAVPHTLNGVYFNNVESILEGVQSLKDILEKAGLEMEILPGADVHANPEIFRMIHDGRVMTLNHTGRAVLVEFPEYFFPDTMCRFIESIVEEGVIPVISHPERIIQFQDPGLLKKMVELGALTQVTAMSLTGEFSQEVQTVTRTFIKEGLVHVIASDAHSARHRPPVLSRAVAEASEIVGREQALLMTTGNPRAILQGKRPFVK